MKILFFPSDVGGGFGHISRCLALASEAGRRGHECGFVLNGDVFIKKIPRQFKIFSPERLSIARHMLTAARKRFAHPGYESPPLFMVVSTMDYQLIRDGLVSSGVVEDMIDRYGRIVETYKPDLLVGDANLLTGIIAKKFCLPIVQIVQAAYHPVDGKVIWWCKVPEGLLPPRGYLLFNTVLEKMGLATIGKTEELLSGDLYIVPGIPELDPVREDCKTYYVGELSYSQDEGNLKPYIRELNGRQPLVYVTVGGGAGNVGNKMFFSTLVEAFAGKDIRVVVSMGSRFRPDEFPAPPRNVCFLQWAPGKLFMSNADMVIFHGGHNTMTESVVCGKPTITVPFHSEQEGNGRRLEQGGCGLVVKLSKESYKRVEAKWMYGTYSLMVQSRYDLTPEQLSEKVEEILSCSAYTDRTLMLQKKIREYQGPEKAVDLIEKAGGRYEITM